MSWLFRVGVMLFLSCWLLLPHRARAAVEIDRKTPRAAMTTFLELCREGDYTRAAQGFNRSGTSPATAKIATSELARQLCVILERAVTIDLDELSDNEKGNPDDGAHDVIATIPLERGEAQLALSPVSGRGWLVSTPSLAKVPELYDRYGPTLLEERLPPHITQPRFGNMAVWKWVGLVLALLFALAVGVVLNWILVHLARRITSQTKVTWDDALVDRLRRPSRAFACLVSFRALLELLGLPAGKLDTVSTLLKIGFIGVMAWSIMTVGGLIADDLEQRAISAAKTQTRELRARGIRTQVQVLRRVFSIAIGIIAAALMLTQFEVVRNVGMSLLASAGVAGVVLGLAAQRTIGSLIAGIQLSITQPVRIGDEVVIEKEAGVIEEITLTYVVVKIWDERRLIVPMSRFLEQPFENWTKVASPLHGTVFLHTHPALPVSAVRTELERLLENHPLWDHRTKKVHVTDSNDRAMVVRVLVSAQSAGVLSELRNDLREKLLAWLAAFEGGRYVVSCDPPGH